jgi:hypothetical protein
MSKLVRSVIAGIAVTMMVLASPATAKPKPYADPEVDWVGRNVHVSPDGSKAFVVGKYRCYGGRSGSHLWVSVKQGPDLQEPDQTGSSYADAWYDTNCNFENSEAGLTVDCDGHWHVARITMKQVFGELTDGPGYVQFCLFDNTSTETNFPQGFAQDYGFRTVRVP